MTEINTRRDLGTHRNTFQNKIGRKVYVLFHSFLPCIMFIFFDSARCLGLALVRLSLCSFGYPQDTHFRNSTSRLFFIIITFLLCFFFGGRCLKSTRVLQKPAMLIRKLSTVPTVSVTMGLTALINTKPPFRRL